ncbi:MAG: hypothetical protein ABSB74_13745 [Tepidisphaeraceae bacterium]
MLWESTDDNPWFLFAGPFRPGRYVVSFVGRALDGMPPSAMKLYIADQAGQFCESEFIAMHSLTFSPEAVPHTLTFDLPRHAPLIRFDPAEFAGRFELGRLTIKRQPKIIRAARISAALASLMVRSPRRFVNLVARYAEEYKPGNDSAAPPISVGVSLPDVAPMNLRPVPGREPRLNVLIPGLAMRAMSGGPNTAFNLTYRLARHGVPIRYISTDVEMDWDVNVLWDHFSKVSGVDRRLANVELVSAHDRGIPTEIGEADVFFGTAWWTVQMIKHALPRMRTRQFIYMIQDFEPGLYAWSTRYALAMETYSMDFFGIINSRTLADFLFSQKVGRFADPAFAQKCLTFDPALDRRLFFPELPGNFGGKQRLLFYARPGAPRNLYELGIMALRQAVERGAFGADGWELLFIGESLPPIHLGNNVVIRQSPWSSYEDYARLLRSSTVGLSLMLSPHPSYPPLEMGVCGMLPVTTTFSVKSAEVLHRYCRNIIAVPPHLEAVVEGLMEAFMRSGDTESRRLNAASSLPATWDEVFEPMIPPIAEFWRRSAATAQR